MKTNTSIDIYAYWDALRGNRAAPLRSEIDPSHIRHLLPDLFVLTDSNDGSPVFRLTGTRLYNLFGRELRETAFSALWQADQSGDACRIASGVMQNERPVLFDIEAESESGHLRQEFEMLLLPLQAEPHFPARLLGALVSDPPLADFGQPFQPLSLTRSRLLEPQFPRLLSSNLDKAGTRYGGVSL
ncbi:hypothetical protein GGQ73_003557 [Rhizobium skierniewicense]|uniref:PAS domain-containing protein n=1 Tax=Rhizobium skierniewicense TaxID=984260 RepID=A0A7W6CAN3_9HYPH|nr:PAS domain-containing protein [Rhizobium skierniewicense]MBB3947589.1 hypothetical protein [Rhizobium skierniewicense]